MQQSFIHSKTGKRVLTVDEHLFNQNKTYKPKNGGPTVIYWQCERRRDIGCTVTLTTDENGEIIKRPKTSHIHGITESRARAVSVRNGLLSESCRRPEASPAAILNEFVTSDVVLGLGTESALKQAIQRRRRLLRPSEPQTADDVLISGRWLQTIDGNDWFLGRVDVENAQGYIFATEDNLNSLKVRTCTFLTCLMIHL